MQRQLRAMTTPCFAALLLALAWGCAPGATAHAEGKSDGAKVYQEKKCARCHKDGGKRDLKGVGKRRSAKWLKAYLQQQESIDGKKHKKKFKGTDAELEALVKWLAAQK